MTTEIKVSVDWPRIHDAARAVDQARSGTRIGSDGISDAFGGTYSAAAYERRGLAGLRALANGADSIRRGAWSAIHAAVRGGREGRRTAQAACRVVLALDVLDSALAETGISERAGLHTICGTDGRHVALTGLSWLAGMERDNRWPSVAAVRAFADGGSIADMRAALEADDVGRAHVAAYDHV